MEERRQKILDVSALAGHILLENGAEISRVEETMERICGHFGEDSANFFVLSNGIFTTSESGFAKAEFIPFKGAQLERVAAVNQLSRDVCSGNLSLDDIHEKLLGIRNMPGKNRLVQILGSAFGSAGFCMIFGGGAADSLTAFVVSAVLWMFVVMVSAPYLSKMVGNIIGSAIATALCIILHRAGLGENLGNIIIGALIPLIPGIPFTNGIKDIGSEDYIAGTTRLLDAMLVFFCIAIGVVAAFSTDAMLTGSMILLHGNSTDPVTAAIPVQAIAAFVGTAGFCILFGLPYKNIAAASLAATAGWMVYLMLSRYTDLGVTVSTIAGAASVVLISRYFAPLFKTPSTIFLIPGIFPMVPGGGLFWTSYFLASNQMQEAVSAGYTAVKITIAIVIGIIFVSALPSAHFKSVSRRS